MDVGERAGLCGGGGVVPQVNERERVQVLAHVERGERRVVHGVGRLGGRGTEEADATRERAFEQVCVDAVGHDDAADGVPRVREPGAHRVRAARARAAQDVASFGARGTILCGKRRGQTGGERDAAREGDVPRESCPAFEGRPGEP